MKSIRLRLAAKIVLFLGLASTIIGAGAYCIICMPEVLNVPFEWHYLLIVGIAAAVCTLISAILFACANAATDADELSTAVLEDDKEEETADAMAALAVEPEEEATVPTEDAVEINVEEEAPAEYIEPEPPTKKKSLIPKEKLPTVKKIALIAIPVVIAGTALTVAIVKGKKKRQLERERKEKEMLRRAIYQWLG